MVAHVPRWAVVGQRYTCPSPKCAWSWEFTGDGWRGPRYPDGDGYDKVTPHDQFKDNYADCWSAIRRQHRN